MAQITPPPTILDLQFQLLNGDANEVESEIILYFESNAIKLTSVIDSTNADYFKLLSVAYKEQGAFKIAEDITLRLIAYYISKNNHLDCADCYLNLSIIYRHVCRYNDALKNLANAEEIYIRLEVPEKMAKCEHTMGMIYYYLEYYEEAIKRIKNASRKYREAIPLVKGDAFRVKYSKLGIIYCKHFLGVLKFEKLEKDAALDLLIAAKQDGEKIKHDRLLGYIYQDLGKYYLLSEPFSSEEAESYFEKSESIRKEKTDRKGTAICFLYRGMLNGKLAKWKKARGCYRDAIKEAENLEALDIRIRAYEELFEVYLRLDRPNKAINAIKNYESLKRIESEKKKTNRVQLEILLPLHAEVKEMKDELARYRECMAISGEVLDLLVPSAAKNINRKLISPEYLNVFHDNRDLLRSEDPKQTLKAVRDRMDALNAIYTNKKIKARPMWNRDKDVLLKHVYDQLIDQRLIEECGLREFKRIVCDERKGQDTVFINWKGTYSKLASFFLWLQEYKLLDSDFPNSNLVTIQSKFKIYNVDIVRTSLGNAFAENRHYFKSSIPEELKKKKDYQTFHEMEAFVESIVKIKPRKSKT